MINIKKKLALNLNIGLLQLKKLKFLLACLALLALGYLNKHFFSKASNQMLIKHISIFKYVFLILFQTILLKINCLAENKNQLSVSLFRLTKQIFLNARLKKIKIFLMLMQNKEFSICFRDTKLIPQIAYCVNSNQSNNFSFKNENTGPSPLFSKTNLGKDLLSNTKIKFLSQEAPKRYLSEDLIKLISVFFKSIYCLIS